MPDWLSGERGAWYWLEGGVNASGVMLFSLRAIPLVAETDLGRSCKAHMAAGAFLGSAGVSTFRVLLVYTRKQGLRR